MATRQKTVDPGRVGLIDITQVRHMLGVSERAIHTYLKFDKDPLPIYIRGTGGFSGNKHQFNIQDVFEWGVRYRLRDLMPEGEEGEPQVIYNGKQEQARLHKEKADSEAIKNMILRKEYAPIVLLEEALANLSSQVGAVLGALPSQLKLRFSWLTGQQVTLIKTEIVKTQNQVAKVNIDINRLYGAPEEVEEVEGTESWLG